MRVHEGKIPKVVDMARTPMIHIVSYIMGVDATILNTNLYTTKTQNLSDIYHDIYECVCVCVRVCLEYIRIGICNTVHFVYHARITGSI